MRALLGTFALALIGSQTAVTAGSGDRTLWLYHTHTGQEAKFTFKHDGVYDQNVLNQMNIFLADWRNKKPTKMDPRLFDLLWEVYQEVGGNQPYNIVSAYRTPETNAYLRSRSSGVAENSQHMLGHAMDVFIPGVPLATLRAAAMRHQVGGVGYYPTSGSPFVHMDTGSVRAWPRMTRSQLARVFPDGKTLHLPVDGKPLSETGRQYAMAQWSKCHMVPCDGSPLPAVLGTGDTIQVAALDPAQRNVPTITVVAPTPAERPTSMLANATLAAPFATGAVVLPASKSTQMLVATRATDPNEALDALNQAAPQPRTLMTGQEGPILTAYAPDTIPDEGARRALQMLIERETTASATTGPATAPLPLPADVRVAALGGTNGMTTLRGMFDLTWNAMSQTSGSSDMAKALASAVADRTPLKDLPSHDTDLVAPEIDHVTETLMTPVPMSSMHYAELYEVEGFLDHTAELGPMANRIGLESDLAAPPAYDRFELRAPMIVATR